MSVWKRGFVMSFRTIVVKNRCKLEYSLNYLICRGNDDEKRILLDEIDFLIIQNTGVSITCALMSMLVEKKIKVLFCDSKSNPQFELTPYYNNFETYRKIMEQVSVDKDFKGELWKRIVHEKIRNEWRLLVRVGSENSSKLEGYLKEIEADDSSNREGHAAKVYFNSIFGTGFSRGNDEDERNAFLNYGYSILVSLINREIKMAGYLTEVGIHHRGETNSFNFSYDIVEPLRTYVDSFVVSGKANASNYKGFFIYMLENKVFINDKLMYLNNAIHVYVQSVISALSKKDVNEVKFIEYEL